MFCLAVNFVFYLPNKLHCPLKPLYFISFTNSSMLVQNCHDTLFVQPKPAMLPGTLSLISLDPFQLSALHWLPTRPEAVVHPSPGHCPRKAATPFVSQPEQKPGGICTGSLLSLSLRGDSFPPTTTTINVSVTAPYHTALPICIHWGWEQKVRDEPGVGRKTPFLLLQVHLHPHPAGFCHGRQETIAAWAPLTSCHHTPGDPA